MNQLIKLIASTFLFLHCAFAAGNISDKEKKEIEQLLLFEKASIRVKQGYDTGTLYILNVLVQGKNDTIYLTKDKKYLISGDVVGTQNGKLLEVPIDLEFAHNKEAFTFGTGKDEYILFTDMECPYCKRFEAYFAQIEKDVKIRIFFYPLSTHKNARDLSLYVMSQSSYPQKVKAMMHASKKESTQLKEKITSEELAKLELHLNKQIEVANLFGVQGTPTLLDAQGNKISWVAMLESYGIKVR